VFVGGTTRRWRAVAWSMAAGAAYDWVFAVSILLFTEPAAEVLGLEVPPDPVYLHLSGVLLLLLGALYALAVVAPERHQRIVAVASGGRAIGFLFLASAWAVGRPSAFLAVALGDLALAIAHAVLLFVARRGAA